MTTEPIRLLDRADVPEGERSLLEAGRFGAPVEYDVAAGQARFRTQLAALAAAGAAASAGAGSSTAGGKTLLAKLALKIVLGVAAGAAFSAVGVIAGMHLAQSSSRAALVHAPPRGETATATPAASPVGGASPSVEIPPVSPPAVPSLAVEEAPALRRGPARGTPSPELTRHAAPASARASAAPVPAARAPAELADESAESAPAAPAPPVEAPAPTVAPSPPVATASTQAPKLSEISAVALARDLVDRDPEAALALLAKTQREHPTGYFVEERQALTVMALVRAGHQAAAREQAATFLRAYPNGPFSDRVRSVAGL